MMCKPWRNHLNDSRLLRYKVTTGSPHQHSTQLVKHKFLATKIVQLVVMNNYWYISQWKTSWLYHETWFGPKTVGHVEFRCCVDLSSIQVSEDKSIHMVQYRSFLNGHFQLFSMHWIRFLKLFLVRRPFRHTFWIIRVSKDERAVCWIFRICRRHN